MLRLTLVVAALVACDKGPIQEHRIEYVFSGMAGPGATVHVDLDRRTVVRRHDKDVTQAALSEADAKQLGELASCARGEKADSPPVPDANTSLVLEGDKRREIAHGGPATTPCTAKLEARLAEYAHD